MSTAGAAAPPIPAPTRSVDPRKLEERRRFLRAAAMGGTAVGFSLLGLLPAAAHGARLRPPGALDERDLLAACIKCGQCVQVCPVEAIKQAGLQDGAGVGVPYIVPRDQACDFACDVGQCILACPTGALSYHKPDYFPVRTGAELAAAPVLIAKVNEPEPTLEFRERMGVARLVRPDACLSVLGQKVDGPARAGFDALKRYTDVDRWKPAHVESHPYHLERCDLCVRECPIEGAISIEKRPGPNGTEAFTPVVHERCVGCGVCEMMCPAEPAAIRVEPRATWKEGGDGT
jgi:ferredoxin-type protein NapG